jgi:hypothetical protein
MRHAQLSALVESHLANPAPALANHAPMPAGKTAHIIAGEFFVQVPRHGQLVEQFTDGGGHNLSLSPL